MKPRTVPARRPSDRRRGRLLLVGVAILVLAACGTRPAADRYGSLPAFLPASSPHPDSVLTGSAARAAITSEGDGVEVRLARGTALVTVTGPEVPGEGLAYQTPATTCTWTVTVTNITGRVPMDLGSWSTLDRRGATYRPTWVAGQHRRGPHALGSGRLARRRRVGFRRRERLTPRDISSMGMRSRSFLRSMRTGPP